MSETKVKLIAQSAKKSARILLQTALLPVLVYSSSGCSLPFNNLGASIQPQTVAQAKESNLANADVEALVGMGPRVAGTPVMEKASGYLIDQYRQAGYVTKVQTFTYSKYLDLGSNLTVGGQTIEGNALNGSIPGKRQARLVVVDDVGRPADFAKVDVKGAIAIVMRGGIRFSEKARNALDRGAVGLIVVNNQPGGLSGASLGEDIKIPVLGISSESGKVLISLSRKTPLSANLNVNAQQREITGRNVIAHLPNVTQPKMILGAHYDSVAGAPGANDNASGTAVVLDLARRLSKTPQARQVWFISFDGEEDGLRGSRAFVEKAQPQFLSNLKAMMNFDMVGVNKDLGLGGTPELTAKVKQGNPNLKSYGFDGASDHASFAAKKVPVLFFFRGMEPNYHTPNDKKVDAKLIDETTNTALDVMKKMF